MSPSPNSKLLQRTIELKYTNKKRSRSFKWILVNAVFLLIFIYDLSYKCSSYTSVLHYVELISAGILAANLVHYAICLAPSRCSKLPLSPEQQKLLGLSNTDLDSSFILTDHNSSVICDDDRDARLDAELSLWPRRASPRDSPIRSSQASPLGSLHSSSPGSPFNSSHGSPFGSSYGSPLSSLPSSPLGSPQNSTHRVSPPSAALDYFTDRDSLAEYLECCAVSGRPAPLYQLAVLDCAGGGKAEESSAQGSPRVWRRLELDPQRLTQWNLNLRLWIHVTILARLVRELAAADEALARLALCEPGALRADRVPPARLRALARHHPSLAALAPFLEPFPDQRYLLRRAAELAQGGCLSEYRWDGGGADWDASKPTDAELVLHLFATYLDGQLPAGGSARPFSAEHVAEARDAGGRALAVLRAGARPPHYALAVDGETLAVRRGRNNLLHTLLLLLAAAARAEPPALARTHLGRAGLNMLWIIGR